jgi:hypothetical protein
VDVILHASRLDDDSATLCTANVDRKNRKTRPNESVNCPTCRAILNHVRERYPQHADYGDWRLTREQMREAARDMARDLLGVEG